MPWPVGIIVILALASAPFHWYVLHRTIVALVRVTGWSKKTIRMVAAVPVIWVALYPLLFIGSNALGMVRVFRALQSAELLIDGLIVYPFWISIVMSVQIAMYLLVIDENSIRANSRDSRIMIPEIGCEF